MTNKFSICGVIRVDLIASEGNGTTHHRRIALPFVCCISLRGLSISL